MVCDDGEADATEAAPIFSFFSPQRFRLLFEEVEPVSSGVETAFTEKEGDVSG